MGKSTEENVLDPFGAHFGVSEMRKAYDTHAHTHTHKHTHTHTHIHTHKHTSMASRSEVRPEGEAERNRRMTNVREKEGADGGGWWKLR